MTAGEDHLIHASCVAIGARAVLITGASGSGKSDLAYRLIDRGAVLVSDDYCRLQSQGGALLACAPDQIAGNIELRGVGILPLPFVSAVPVALLVDLDLAPERLPEVTNRTFLGVALPCTGLRGLEPSAPMKVEAALRLHGLSAPCLF